MRRLAGDPYETRRVLEKVGSDILGSVVLDNITVANNQQTRLKS